MNNCLVLSLILVLICFSPLLANGRKLGEENLVNQICTKVVDKENCMNYAKVADPQIVNAKSYYELAEVVLQVGLKKAMEGQKFLKDLAQVEKNPAIEKCANIYEQYVINSFNMISIEVKSRDDTASYDAGIARDEVDSCETELENAKIDNPDINALNSHITWFLQIAFSAICNYE